MNTVLFAPEVEEDLFELTKIQKYIDSLPHKNAPSYFDRYGYDAKYITYKRNNNTTWYIIFVERANAYLVTHITNNHVSGQYFNQ